MSKFTMTQTIDCTVEDAFRVITDFKNYPAWDPVTKQVDEISAGDVGEGTEFVVTMPRTGTQRFAVTGFEMNESLTISPFSRMASGSLRFDMSELDGKTRIVHTFEMSMKGFGRIFLPLSPIFSRMWRKHTRERAAGLQAHLETPPQADAG